ncbi:MAG: DUF1189 family protein [Deltaproteobacteria bacterium]|nr:DUF1189 family protein [Deltaproteobacteria bacterium]
MGVTRFIIKTHPLVFIGILVACLIAATWGLIAVAAPKAQALLLRVADKYDAYLPEIVVKNGKASIKREEPFFVETFGERDLAFIIDTRQDGVNKAMDYLKEAKVGAVLTRDSLVTKNQRDIRVFPLTGIPDLTVNSAEIRALTEEFLPHVVRWAWVVLLSYFLFAKSLQILCMALIPFFAARAYSVTLKYGQSLKIATAAMVPPVLVDLLFGYFDLWMIGSFIVYFGLFIGFVILAAGDLIRSAGEFQYQPHSRPPLR